MKKILYIISDILMAALLAGAYMLQYYAKRKLGMNRWIVFKIAKIKDAVPIETMRYAAVAAVLVFAALLALNYGRHRKEYKKVVFLMVIFMAVLAAFYFVLTVCFSQESMRAYYLVLPLIGLCNLVQLIKVLVAMKWCRVHKL